MPDFSHESFWKKMFYLKHFFPCHEFHFFVSIVTIDDLFGINHLRAFNFVQCFILEEMVVSNAKGKQLNRRVHPGQKKN